MQPKESPKNDPSSFLTAKKVLVQFSLRDIFSISFSTITKKNKGFWGVLGFWGFGVLGQVYT